MQKASPSEKLEYQVVHLGLGDDKLVATFSQLEDANNTLI
jgi:hypothetical protein